MLQSVVYGFFCNFLILSAVMLLERLRCEPELEIAAIEHADIVPPTTITPSQFSLSGNAIMWRTSQSIRCQAR
jgi:hypothetical protein